MVLFPDCLRDLRALRGECTLMYGRVESDAYGFGTPRLDIECNDAATHIWRLLTEWSVDLPSTGCRHAECNGARSEIRRLRTE